MAIDVQIVGWNHDPRYETERQRVHEHIEEVSRAHGYASAVTEYVNHTLSFALSVPVCKVCKAHRKSSDIMIRARYRLFGLHVTVKFKKLEWVENRDPKYVLARLYFDENADLQDRDPNPLWLGEIDPKEVVERL